MNYILYGCLALLAAALSIGARKLFHVALSSEKEGAPQWTHPIIAGVLAVFVALMVFGAFVLVRNYLSTREAQLAIESIRYGYIDKDGKTVIPFQFSHAGPFENGCAYVETSTASYWIDSLGNKAQNQDLHYANPPARRSLTERIGGDVELHEYFKHKKGETTVVDSLSEGVRLVSVITGKYTSGTDFHYLIYRYGFQDTSGHMEVAPAFVNAFSFREGRALVLDTLAFDSGLYKVGFIDHSGHYCVAPQYYDAGDFHEGKAAVSKVTLK